MGDVSITHPFTGKGRKQTWGQFRPGALAERHAEKTCKYYADHRREGYLFVPLVATTFGQVTADSVILCHILGHSTATEFFLARWWATVSDNGYSKGFLQCRSRFTTRYKTRIGHSVCAAAGARGLIGAAPSLAPESAVVCVSELDYWEDLPLGPMGARAA